MNISKEILNQLLAQLNQELEINYISGLITELEKCRENKLSLDSQEPKLLFDNFFILENFPDFFQIYSQHSKDNFSIKTLISKSLCLFKSLKYISEKSEDEEIKQKILNYLNDSVKLLNSKNISKNEILFPYFHFLTSLDILDSDILDINSFKNKYNFSEYLVKCLKINSFENNNGNELNWIIYFIANPLNLIHYFY